MPRKIGYDTDNLGKMIKEERETRAESARVSRPSRSIQRNDFTYGKRQSRLNSVQTRRQVAKALGLSPLALGVGSEADVKAEPVYNTNILRMTLDLHREAYYTTGNFGVPAINTMVSEIDSILKEKDNPKDILEIYTEYNILGIHVGKEEMDCWVNYPVYRNIT